MELSPLEFKYNSMVHIGIQNFATQSMDDLRRSFFDLESLSLDIDSTTVGYQIRLDGQVYGLPISSAYHGESLAVGLKVLFSDLEFQLAECQKIHP